MAGGSNIRAGAAFVEVSLKDSFSKPLKAMGQQLKQFGSSVASIGAGVGAAGAAITAPFIAGVKAFADFGSAVYDAGQRSGLSAELISTLQYAAEQTGSSLGDVETAAKKLNVTIAGAAKGEKSSVDALKAIGLAYEDLAGLSPDQQFRKVSAALAGVTDNATQVAAAVDLFGRSGTSIIPLARDFASLEENAKRLGLVMSGTDAAAADALGDSLDDLSKTVGSLFREFGAAIAGPLTKFVSSVSANISSITAWAKKNREIIASVAAVGVTLTTAGAAIVAAGASISALGFVVAGLAGGVAALPAIISAIPTALALVGIAAGSAAIILGDLGIALALTGTKLADLAKIGSDFSANFSAVFSSVKKAISAGDLALAAQVGMAGVIKTFYDAAETIGQIMARLVKGIISLLQTAFIALGPPIYLALAALKKEVDSTLDFSDAASKAAKEFQGLAKKADEAKGTSDQKAQGAARNADDKKAIDAISKRAASARTAKEGESGKAVVGKQLSLVTGIVDFFRAPFAALEKAQADANAGTESAEGPSLVARNRGTTGFRTDQIDTTKRSFESEGAFAGLNLASFIGGAPDDAADDTAKNTSEMIKKQDKTNNILDKIYNTGGLTFS